MARLHTSPTGLTTIQARRRLRRHGPNVLRLRREAGPARLLLRQFESPLVLILLVAAAIAAVLRDWLDALIVLVILLISAILGFIQEYQASAALQRLRARLQVRTTVWRDGKPVSVPAETVVPGDIVQLSAGSLIPADGVLVSAKDFFVNEAVLTGETLPVEKHPGVAPAAAGLGQQRNAVFLGTSVRSGTAQALIVRTGTATAFGAIAGRLRLRPPETDFEHGLRRFGYLLTRIMIAIVLAVFAANVFLERPAIDALLFAMALAVGMSPELLPAIVTITLAHGARGMAARGVIVRRLSAIENLGSMQILCADKTGTLTEGVMRLDGAVAPDGRPSDRVLELAAINARLQTGLANPLDEAILAEAPSATNVRKLDEIPYDFVRKRLSVVVESPGDGAPLLITKGAFAPMLAICARLYTDTGEIEITEAVRAELAMRFEAWSADGYRVLGLASRRLAPQPAYGAEAEIDMTFEGFLLFFDPPKVDVQRTLADLAALGVRLKIITGDNRLAALHVARAVGMTAPAVLTGAQLDDMRDEALWRSAPATDLFVEVDPNQKERIILALRRLGHVVGYIGDGINDAPALHAADVGISVDKAVDVAKEAADMVLLEHDLDVLRQGIEEGRATFANSMKYIFVTTSANFGNMVSMAVASVVLPFLPLLAPQILLNNLLSDLPAMAISGDSVDREQVERPPRWDMRAIRNFMITFGLVSSLFDAVTFAALLALAGEVVDLFRTGWFVESLATEVLAMLVIRSRRPFFRSRPGRLLLGATLAVLAAAVVLPYLPLGHLFDLVPLPWPVLLTLFGITAAYVLASELTKQALLRRLMPANAATA